MTGGCGRTIRYLRLSVQTCATTAAAAVTVCRKQTSKNEPIAIFFCGGVRGDRPDRSKLRREKICLTSGEPLVRHEILEICRDLSAISGLDELYGSRLPELAAPLKEAGVSRLNVSLGTLCPDRFSHITRRGCLSDVLTGLEAAERARFLNLKCNMVLIGGFNDSEIKDFVTLTEHRPWEICFIELMHMGQCADWEKGCFLPAEEVLRQVPALRPCEPSGTAARYRVPGAGKRRYHARRLPHSSDRRYLRGEHQYRGHRFEAPAGGDPPAHREFPS